MKLNLQQEFIFSIKTEAVSIPSNNRKQERKPNQLKGVRSQR